MNFLFGTSSNLAQGSILSFEWFKRSSKGRLVTTPYFKKKLLMRKKNKKLTSPLGKVSIPIIDSKTDDLPADYPPKTQILGSFIYYCNPTSLNSSFINSLNYSIIQSTYNDANKFSKLLIHKATTFFSLITHIIF